MKAPNSFLHNTDKIAVVIPTYNESGRIRSVVEKTLELYKNVIIVDDHSKDGTVDEIKKYKLKIIQLPQNMGAGFATRTGCDWAFEHTNAEIVVTIDGDGQHAPEDVFPVIEKLIKDDLDIVFGFRSRKKTMPLIKKLGNYTLSKLSYLLFGVKLTDTLTGFHAFAKDAYPKIRWSSHRYAFVSELIYQVYRNNLKYGETAVQTIYNDKVGGMMIRDGIKSILLMFYWKLKK